MKGRRRRDTEPHDHPPDRSQGPSLPLDADGGRPLRIGMVCPYSLTLPGGVQGQVLGLARSLRRMGHDTRVLGPCDGAPPDPGVIPLGRSLPTAANGSVAAIAPDVPAQLRTIRALREERFDVLHVHEPLVPGPSMTSVLMRNAPVVGTFHAAGGSAAYTWLGLGLRRLAERIDMRVAVSSDAQKLAERVLHGDFRLLFNGIEVERFAAAEPWPTDGRPTVLFLGRHEPRKGLGVLLAAAAHLPPDVRIWVAGTGPDTEALRTRHAGDPRIEWLGRVSDHERDRRLAGADAFCVPSLHGESFGVVLLEGMAAGTPVVGGDIPGYAAVARHGRDALLVPPGDAAALGGALLRVLGDAWLAHRLVSAGRQRAAEFSMDSLAATYLSIYRELCGG